MSLCVVFLCCFVPDAIHDYAAKAHGLPIYDVIIWGSSCLAWNCFCDSTTAVWHNRTVLHCIVLYCAVLYGMLLNCTVVCCAVLYNCVLYRIMLQPASA